MKKIIKKATSGIMAVLSLATLANGAAMTASAAGNISISVPTDKYNASFVYKYEEPDPYGDHEISELEHPIEGISFGVCEDKNGDGKFTRGVDDTSVYKVKSDENGRVTFKRLKTGTTYFITQTDSQGNRDLYTDKNVYAFNVDSSKAGKTVDLLDYLPYNVYAAERRASVFFQYGIPVVEGEEKEIHGFNNVTFGICPDMDGDGKFTHGVDDVVMYKSTSRNGGNDGGNVFFENLRLRTTYFITQLSMGEEARELLIHDKNVYSFYLDSNDFYNDRHVYDGYYDHYDLREFLPNGALEAHFKSEAYFMYTDNKGNPVEGTTFAICADVNGDGVFTRGIDDKTVYKYVSDERGFVIIDNLISGNRYFITQTSSDKYYACNKNVYSFVLSDTYAMRNTRDSIVEDYKGYDKYERGRRAVFNLRGLLPKSAVVARKR